MKESVRKVAGLKAHLARGARRRRLAQAAVALAVLAGVVSQAALATSEPVNAFDVLRTGAPANKNFKLDGKDDARVDTDIALLGVGMPPEVAGLNVYRTTDCVNPDPNAEVQGRYTPPSTKEMEDPKKWWADPRLDGKGLGPYGCREGAGEATQDEPGTMTESAGLGEAAASIDGALYTGLLGGVSEFVEGVPGLGGPASGARIWNVRALAGGDTFGRYIDPTSSSVAIAGGGPSELTTARGTIACGEGHLQGTIPRPPAGQSVSTPVGRSAIATKQLPLNAEYSGCSRQGVSSRVLMNSCHYTVTVDNAGPPYTGKLGVACEKEGDAIQFQELSGAEVLCTAAVKPQQGLAGVNLIVLGKHAARSLELQANVGGLTYQLEGSGCGGQAGSYANGALKGTTAMSGSREGESQVAVFVGGEPTAGEADQPQFRGEVRHLPAMGTDHMVAGLDWVAEHANEIEVAYIFGGCYREGLPHEWGYYNEDCGASEEALLKEAIANLVNKGVAVVVPGYAQGGSDFPLGVDNSIATPQNLPDSFVVGGIDDTDGKPGGLGSSCPNAGDDTRPPVIGWGPTVDIGAPPGCGDTGNSTAKVAGALAALASQCNPENRAGVEKIENALLAEGKTGTIDEGGWEDTSGDGYKEPMLDLSNEKAFDPKMVGEEQAPKCDQLPGSEPVAAYSFDEGEGTVAHDSANNHDGTLEGGTTWTTEGKYGDAIDFNGTNGFVSIADANDLDLTKEFTLEAWVKPDTNSASGRPLISKVESTGGTSGYFMGLQSEGKPQGLVASAGTTKSATAPSALPLGAWSHVALTSDGTTMRLYVNGAEATSAPALSAKANAVKLAIGKGQLIGTYFDGKIDEVRLYNRTLAKSEIEEDRVTPIGQGPVAAYSFDEGEGTIAHDSANNHDGTLEGGTTWTTEGKYGDAIDFNGTNGFVSIADANDLDLTKEFTLEAWVKPDTNSASGRPLISKVESTGGTSGYFMGLQSEGKPQGLVASAGTTKSATAPSALPLGAWSHVALTSDGTTMRLYVNGAEATSAPALSAKANAVKLAIGKGQLIGTYFDGKIDEVRLYNRTLAKSEIEEDRVTPIGQGPVAAYSFDEGEGTVAHDSANNHDGTLEGGTTWTTEGKYGDAIDFNGTNGFVKVANAADLNLTKSLTLEAWVKPDTLSGWSPVVSKAQTNTGYLLSAQREKEPAGDVGAGSLVGVNGSGPLPTGAWSYLAFTSDGTTLRLYVNGALVASAAGVVAGENTNSLAIGKNQLLGTYFDGKIDEVRVYDRPLGQKEIEEDRDEAVEVPAPW